MLQHKNLLKVCTAFLLLVGIAHCTGATFIQIAHAASDAPSPSETDLQGFVKTLAPLFDFLTLIVFMALRFLSLLLDPDFIFAINGGVNGDGKLLQIWQLSRDVVNIILAFLLVFAALYTVVTANMEKVKEKAGKFVLAVILVNFSWFIPRLVLDVANVLTATIYMIPTALNTQCFSRDPGSGAPVGSCQYIKKVHLMSAEADDPCLTTTNPNVKRVSDSVCVELGNLPTNTNTSTGMLHGMLVNHLGIVENFSTIPHISLEGDPGSSTQKIKYFLRFVASFLFIFAFMAMIAVPIIGMAVMFFVRMIVIWLTVSFMPFAFIGMVLGGDINTEFDPTQIWTHFWRAAFLPAALAVPLSVGYIMISAGISTPCPSTGGDLIAEFCEEKVGMFNGINNMWELLWVFLALFIMYTGFFMAAKIDDIYNKIGASIKGVGDSYLKFPFKAGLAMPLIPMGKGEPLSALQVGQVGLDPSRSLIRNGKFSPDILAGLGGGKGSEGGKGGDTTNNTDVSAKLDSTQINNIHNILNGTGDAKQAADDLKGKLGKLNEQNIKEAIEKLSEEALSPIKTDADIQKIVDEIKVHI